MSTELESLIRPFQSKEVTPSRDYHNFGEIGVHNIVLQIGRGGSGKVMTGSYSYSATFYCEQIQIQSEHVLVGPGESNKGNY